MMPDPTPTARTSKPPVVTHVITGLNVGGAERALSALLTGGLQGLVMNRVISLMDEGHYGPLLREAGIEVSCLGMKRGLPPPAVFGRLRRALHAAPQDIVHGWMYHGNLAASVGARIAFGRPAVAWNIRTSMDDPSLIARSTRMVSAFEARISGSVDAIVYNSARSRLQHHDLGYSARRDIVIPNGFDLDLWGHGREARALARAELGLSDGELVAGYVGRGAPVKDVPTLLRAFAQVRSRLPNVKLICVGRDIEAQRPAEVSADGVLFLGQRSDVARLLPAFDVFCLSSRVEAFPNVVGEAMACGIPCVTTDVGDALNIVGNTGWVVPPGAPSDFADALELALCEPSQARARRGLAARERIRAHYGLPAIVSRYAEFYQKIRKTGQCAESQDIGER